MLFLVLAIDRLLFGVVGERLFWDEFSTRVKFIGNIHEYYPMPGGRTRLVPTRFQRSTSSHDRSSWWCGLNKRRPLQWSETGKAEGMRLEADRKLMLGRGSEAVGIVVLDAVHARRDCDGGHGVGGERTQQRSEING